MQGLNDLKSKQQYVKLCSRPFFRVKKLGWTIIHDTTEGKGQIYLKKVSRCQTSERGKLR